MGHLLAVCLGFFLVALVLAGAETALWIKARLSAPADSAPVIGKQEGSIRHKSMLGWDFVPNGTVRCIARRDGRVIYDVSAKIDAAGRRLTPGCRPGNDASVAVFFGCSMTFGQGVKDEETLPARYCAHAGDCAAFNYGVPGYGPQQMWLQVCRQGVLKEFGTRKGIVVYTFFDDHLNRLAGTAAIIAGWDDAMPWLELRDGQVAQGGTFYDRSPLQYFYLHYINQMHLSRFIEKRFAAGSGQVPQGNPPALELLVKVLIECADTARKQAPGLDFFCMLQPKGSGPWGRLLAERLRGASVRVLDYSALLDNVQTPLEDLFFDDNSVQPWGHPKALNYDLVAGQLSRDTAATNENAPRSGV